MRLAAAGLLAQLFLLLGGCGYNTLQRGDEEIEGTENRIIVARRRSVQAVQDYNVTVRSFPSNLTAMAFGYREKPGFGVANETALVQPPVVDLGSPPRGAAPAASTP